MIPKTLAIIMAGCIGGVFVISVAMMAGAGWETPGSYTGTSNAAHAPTSATNCYSFQAGCTDIKSTVPTSDLDSGAFLSANYH